VRHRHLLRWSKLPAPAQARCGSPPKWTAPGSASKVSAGVTTFRIVGPGRAGSALSLALARRGWVPLDPRRRGDDLWDAGRGADVVVIATPDAVIAQVAQAVVAQPDTTVLHLSGALGPRALLPHQRAAAVHPLVSIPDAETGARVLAQGLWFGVTSTETGRARAREMVEVLGGRWLDIPARQRTAYHAAACVASNHLVVVLAQAARLAEAAGVPFGALEQLVRETAENAFRSGPAAALTGPAARGDRATVESHRVLLSGEDLDLYDTLSRAAARLAGRPG
jgi:predicted short-subunit dehydrogenase-like oxidoreductase (DUF2520 family)